MAASTTLTPSERTIRARIAAYSLHAAGGTTTAAASAAFRQRFEDEVDPDRVLPEAVRARRAEQARRAFYQRLALKSAKARRLRAERKSAQVAE